MRNLISTKRKEFLITQTSSNHHHDAEYDTHIIDASNTNGHTVFLKDSSIDTTNNLNQSLFATNSFIFVNNQTNVVYVVHRQSNQSSYTLSSVSKDNNQTQLTTLSLENESLFSYDQSKIISIKLLSDSNNLSIAFINGELLSLNLDTLDKDYVGQIDHGIIASSWSPDEELVVFVTGRKTILLMTQEYEVITELPINSHHFGEQKQVNVGWGTKETQFHGSLGKEEATKCTTNSNTTNIPISTTFDSNTNASKNSVDCDSEKVMEIKKLSMDEERIKVSWRGDGMFFCVSNCENSKRVLRVYDRNCVLQSTSEDVQGLEGNLTWRPSGNLIASTQKCPNRLDIVFFERNGLRHGQFTVTHDSTAKIADIKWNMSSEVLAVHYIDQFGSYIQLWTMSNYHYYKKQEIKCKEGNFVEFEWDDQFEYILHTYSSGNLLTTHEFTFQITCTTELNKSNAGSVAVIDGNQVLITPFKFANTPPPLGRFNIKFENSVDLVVFGKGDDFCVLVNESVMFYKAFYVLGSCNEPQHIGTLHLNLDKSFLRNLCWIGGNSVAYIQSKTADGLSKDEIVLLTYSDTFSISEKRTIMKIPGDMSLLVYNAELDQLILHTENGGVYIGSTIQPSSLDMHFETNLQDFCPRIATARLQNATFDEEEACVFGLSDRNFLRVGGRLLLNECTSFFIHDDFLVATTLSHTARFLPLVGSAEDLIFSEVIPFAVDPNNPSVAPPFDEHLRRIERGAQIVVAVPNDVSLILQMPRGNLETVYPRAFALTSLRQKLNERDFKSAFTICRKHRIDTNVLFDHCEKMFTLETWKEFILQIGNVDYLNLFITNLRDEDVCVSMYSKANKTLSEKNQKKNPKELAIKPGKVNGICVVFRQALESIDTELYIQTILTTFAKQTPPDLESAMIKIKEIKSTQSTEAAESALQYIIFLIKVDKLYDIALGMYDFSLVLMVAQNSQKDPREYLPFLSELSRMELNMQKYTIDSFLGKHDKALEWLACSNDAVFSSCLAYTIKYVLYKTAMGIFKDSKYEYNQVLIAYGEYAVSKAEYQEAAILFSFAEEYVLALDAYEQAGLWQQALTLVSEHGKSFKMTINDLATSMSTMMIEKRSFSEAARIQIDYLNNPTDGIKHLLLGLQWQESLRIATKHNFFNLKLDLIYPAVLKEYERLFVDLKETKITFIKQKLRLETVREKKAERTLAPENDINLDIDIMSDTSSMATTRITGFSSTSSRMTNKTGRTSKQRRKWDRKKESSREGGVFEEDFLMNSTKRTTERLCNSQSEYHSLVEILCQFGEFSKSNNLVFAFEDCITEIRVSLKDIFIANPAQSFESIECMKHAVLNGLVDPLDASMSTPLIEAPVIPAGITIGFKFI